MAKQSWAQRSRSWKLDHICCTSSGLHFIQLQTTILDVLKHVTASFICTFWMHQRRCFHGMCDKVLLQRKLWDFPLLRFHGPLASFLLHCFTVHSNVISCDSSALEFPPLPFSLTDDILHTGYMFYSSSSFPSTSTTLMEKNINVFHSSIYEDCSDRTEDRLHCFFRLTSACFWTLQHKHH